MQQRRKEIVDFVNACGTVRFSQLKARFPQVSEMTLRTDLKALDDARKLIRIHGGAKSVDMIVGTDDFLLRRAQRSVPQKTCIAQKALTLLRPDSTIYLDSGSTTTAFARVIPDERYQIFTNSFSCASEPYHLTQARVGLIGGLLNRYSQSLCGIQSIEAIRTIHFDIAFLGTTCYSDKAGFSCGMEDEAHLKRAVIEQSEQSYVLMDASKVDLTSTFSFASLQTVTGIVSDGTLPDTLLARCRELDKNIL